MTGPILDLEKYRAIQAITRGVLEALALSIRPGDTESSLSGRAVAMLSDHGVEETWYYRCPALVLLGSRSCLSVSGKEYLPDEREVVGSLNLVTVDLSPAQGALWGDCARSFCVEEGQYAPEPRHPEFRVGLQVTKSLHEWVRGHARPSMTCDQLFESANQLIAESGFENLDFAKNLGHSIARDLGDRSFIEHGNGRSLAEMQLFTFEPHIRCRGGRWGFKHENIYFFSNDNSLEEL